MENIESIHATLLGEYYLVRNAYDKYFHSREEADRILWEEAKEHWFDLFEEWTAFIDPFYRQQFQDKFFRKVCLF